MIKQYIEGLNKRERIILSVGGVFLMLCLLYLLIYSPLRQAVITKKNQVQEKTDTLKWMKQVRHEFTQQQPLESISKTKLLSVISAQLQEKEIKSYPSQIHQTQTGDIQLSFEKISYQVFLTWLWSIYESYAIDIKQLHIEKINTPGLVKLQLVLNVKNDK